MRVKYDSENYRVEQLSKTDVKKMYPKRNLSPRAKLAREAVDRKLIVVRMVNKNQKGVNLVCELDLIQSLLDEAYGKNEVGLVYFVDLSKSGKNIITGIHTTPDEIIIAVAR